MMFTEVPFIERFAAAEAVFRPLSFVPLRLCRQRDSAQLMRHDSDAGAV